MRMPAEATSTPFVQTRRSKLGLAGGPRKVDFLFLMEKYGTRRKQVLDENKGEEDGVEEAAAAPPEDPGFLIKFRLSNAYKALEKQEVEASIPLLKPHKVKKGRRVSGSLGGSPNVAEVRKASPDSSNDAISSSSKHSARSSRPDKTRRKSSQQLKPTWGKVQKQRTEQQRDSLVPSATDSPLFTLPIEAGNSNSKQAVQTKEAARASKEAFKTSKEAVRTAKQSVQTYKEAFLTTKEAGETGSPKEGVKFIDEVGLTVAEKKRSRTERDRHAPRRTYFPTTRTVRKLMEQGFGSNLLPNVATDSDYGDGPSSAASIRLGSAGSSSSSISSDLMASQPTNQRPARISSANGRRTPLFSRHPTSEEDGQSRKLKRVNKYLYQMCNCKRSGKADTLRTLIHRKQNLSGVIEIYGCPKDTATDDYVVCPFCRVFPQSHITTWLENIDSDEEPF